MDPWDEIQGLDAADLNADMRPRRRAPQQRQPLAQAGFATPGTVPMLATDVAQLLAAQGAAQQAGAARRMTSDVNRAFADEMEARRARAKEERARAERQADKDRVEAMLNRLERARSSQQSGNALQIAPGAYIDTGGQPVRQLAPNAYRIG
jgi:hypothetical protein